MIQFAFNMPLWLMGVYGGAMVLVVLALRLLLGRWLPKRVMPVLWALVLLHGFQNRRIHIGFPA